MNNLATLALAKKDNEKKIDELANSLSKNGKGENLRKTIEWLSANKNFGPDILSELTELRASIKALAEELDKIPDWARAEVKPQYSAEEVGALSADTKIPEALGDLSTDILHDTISVDEREKWNLKSDFDGEFSSLKNIPAFPTKLSELENDKMFISGKKLPTKISELENDEHFISGYTETDPTVPEWAKQKNPPRYNAEDVGAMPADTFIPTALSELENDQHFITKADIPSLPQWIENEKPIYTCDEIGAMPAETKIPTKVSDLEQDVDFSFTETDPTVPAWAKEPNKPQYTCAEIGAMPANAPRVITLNGKSGIVNLTKDDLELSNVRNLSTVNIVEKDNKNNVSSDAVYQALQEKANKGQIPRFTSELINDSGFGAVDTSSFISIEDYASASKPGIVYAPADPNAANGIRISENNHQLYTAYATVDDIKAKMNPYKPITPTNLDVAIKQGLINNSITLTDAEIAAAQKWLGVDVLLNKISALEEEIKKLKE